MRPYLPALLVLAASCQPQAREVQGIYLGHDSQGVFLPCDNGSSVIEVQDTALASRYRALGDTSGAGVFVRLSAVERDSGSVYGSQQYLVLDSVLELRARRPGECPGVAEQSEVLEGS